MRHFLALTLLLILSFLTGIPVQGDIGLAKGEAILQTHASHDCAPNASHHDGKGEDDGCHTDKTGCVKDCCLLLVSLYHVNDSDQFSAVFTHQTLDLTGIGPRRVDPPPYCINGLLRAVLKSRNLKIQTCSLT